jgi:streptogramin lyase
MRVSAPGSVAGLVLLLILGGLVPGAQAADPLGHFTEYSIPTPGGEPTAIAAGADGNLWFTERAADKIGRITPSGQITEYPIPTAGAEPTSIAAGPEGSLWFTERAADAIARITPSGQITEYPMPPVGSRPTAIVAGPDGQFCQAACDRSLWITEPDAGRILEFQPGKAQGNPWWNLDSDYYEHPLEIAAGPEGELWYTDPGKDIVGEVSPQPESMELGAPWPVPTEGSEPSGIALGPHRKMWITEKGAGQIGRFSSRGGGYVAEFPLPTRTAEPSAIVEGPDGEMWFTEEASGRIGRIDQAGEVREFPIPAAGSAPSGIAAGPDGSLWFVDPANDTIGRIGAGPLPPRDMELPTYNGIAEQGRALTAQPGSWTGAPTAFEYQWERCSAAGSSCGPIAGATDPSYELGEADVGHTLRIKVTAENDQGASAPVSSIATGVIAAFGDSWGEVYEFPLPDVFGETPGEPQDITEGSDGNLWFVEWSDKIARVTPSGQVTEFTVPDYARNLQGIAKGADGNIWFGERYVGSIDRITPGGLMSRFSIPRYGISEPTAIAPGPGGNLWFTESARNVIGRISPQGAITEFPIPTEESRPIGIAAGPDGNVWFSEESANQIGRITPAGAITEYATPTEDSRPEAMAEGPDGNVWFAERSVGKIGRITPSGAITEFTVGNWEGPSALAAGPDGNVWFTERGPGRVGRISPEGEVDLFEPATPESEPLGIAAGPGDSIWFTEARGYKVGRIDLAASVPQNLEAPVIEGAAALGERLTATHGSWSHRPTGYAYQWERCDDRGRHCAPIEGAEDAAYVPAEGDRGHALRVQVVATNSFGDGPAASSEPTSPVRGGDSPEVVIATSTTEVDGGSAAIKLSCRGGSPSGRCAGDLRLDRTGGSRRTRRIGHRRHVSFGRHRFYLPTGSTIRVGLHLPSNARILLNARRRVPVKATAAMSSGGGSSRRVVLRRPR